MLTAIAMVPTYNESLNIANLVKDILAIDPAYGVLVVDDDSPDGTSSIVKELQKDNPGRIHLITRKNDRGRGLSGIEGLLYASKLDVKYIVEMDADYSHHPRHIPELISAMSESDLAIGSRAVEGGYESGRGFSRRFITKFANRFIQFVMGVSVKDCTAGYRCFKKHVLLNIKLEKMISIGPSIVEEILYACHIHKYKIKEIPIIFEDRARGESTKTLGQFVETMLRIIQFRLTMKP